MDQRPTLVFDGDCAFCTSSVNVLRRWVKRQPQIVAWQHVDLEPLGVSVEACQDSVQWVGIDGQVKSGAMAVAQVFVHAGKGWWVLGRFMMLPGIRWLAGVVYRWTARNRHRLPGGTPACAITPPRPTDADSPDSAPR